MMSTSRNTQRLDRGSFNGILKIGQIKQKKSNDAPLEEDIALFCIRVRRRWRGGHES